MPVGLGSTAPEDDDRTRLESAPRERWPRTVTTGVAGKPGLRGLVTTRIPPGSGSAFGDLEALAFVLDQMPVGVLLVDRARRVVWMNRCAQALIHSGDGITLRDGRLAATSHGETAALDQVVARAAAWRSSGARGEAETIVLSRPPQAQPLVAVVLRVGRPGGRRVKRAAKAVIFVSDPTHDLRTSRDRLRILFNLTRPESCLVELLAAGHSLRAAAARLAITNESARTYLKHAFAKTGTRRQAELVRLALAAATAGAGDP